MRDNDKKILRLYFELEECQARRIALQRIWHPEKLKWKKRGAPPRPSQAWYVKREAMEALGQGEREYQRWLNLEAATKSALEGEAVIHPLWEHWSRLNKFGPYLCGAFIAAAGDVEKVPTVSAFWQGMGLGMVRRCTKCKWIQKSGKRLDNCPECGGPTKLEIPRNTRGKKDRTGLTLPFVTRIGEQIRQQIIRQEGKLYALYKQNRAKFDEKYPDRAKLFNFEAALRNTQKFLYACSFVEWRRAYGLETPEPYAFGVLNHEHRLSFGDLYDLSDAEVEAKEKKIAAR